MLGKNAFLTVIVVEHCERFCAGSWVSISLSLLQFCFLLMKEENDICQKLFRNSWYYLGAKDSSWRDSSLIQSPFDIFKQVVCDRRGVRHCRAAPIGTLCYGILLFNTDVNMFLLPVVSLDEEGQIASWGLGILNTENQKPTETSFAVKKKKVTGTARKAGCKE